MTARIRLIVLTVALACSIFFAPASALAGHGRRGHLAHKVRSGHGPRLRRSGRRKTAPEPLGERAARFARRFLGSPYRYGGDTPGTGFDCSGLVRFVFGHFGLRLPHSSYADFTLGRSVPRGSLRPGDLVFFDGVGHVGLYIGGGRFIHAPHTGARVEVTSMSDPWYESNYDGARRLVRARPEPSRPHRSPIPRRLRLPVPRLRPPWALAVRAVGTRPLAFAARRWGG